MKLHCLRKRDILNFFFSILFFNSCSLDRKINDKELLLTENPETPRNRTLWTADWSFNDSLIATGGTDSTVRIYSYQPFKLVKQYKFNSWVHSVKWHKDNRRLAIATLEHYIKIADITRDTILDLKSPGGSRAIGWDPAGKYLAVADQDGVLKIWTDEGKLVKSIPKVHRDTTRDVKSFLGMAWHPTKPIIATVVDDITLYDTSGNEIKVLEHRNKAAAILCVVWHPSGEFLVTGDYGHNWEGENVPSLLHFWKEDGSFIRAVGGSKGEYRNIAWNSSGTRMATTSDVLRIWSPNGQLLHSSPGDGMNYLWGLSWNRDGSRIITSSRNGELTLWDKKAKFLYRISVVD